MYERVRPTKNEPQQQEISYPEKEIGKETEIQRNRETELTIKLPSIRVDHLVNNKCNNVNKN